MNTPTVLNHASLDRLRRWREELGGSASFPYSDVLASVMISPVFTLPADETLSSAVAQMAQKNISSTVVTDGDNRILGIFTERDVLRHIASGDIKLEGVRLGQVMTASPRTLSPGCSIFRALAVLKAHGFKHLPVVHEHKLVGMVTLRQLLKLQQPEPMVLLETIGSAQHADDLARVKAQLPCLARQKLLAGAGSLEVVTMLSLINRELHRRTFELAQDTLGPPPAQYSLFVTGSHGRMENLLTPDQDHGLILADDHTEFADYFETLSVHFSRMLDEIGFDNCPGGIMCRNPDWRRTLPQWKEYLARLVKKREAPLTRILTLLFDAKPICGENTLYAALEDFCFGLLGQGDVLRLLAEEAEGHQAPLGFLGRFLTDRKGPHKGGLDLKRSGLRFAVECVRLLALRHQIRETATLDRIKILVERGFINRDDGEMFEVSFRFLLHFALLAQLENEGKGEPIVFPAKISKRDRRLLREACRTIATMEGLVGMELGHY